MALVGLASCCVLGGALAATPCVGIVISLLLAGIAAAHVAGKLHLAALGPRAAWLLGATAVFGLLGSYAALDAERKKEAEQAAENARSAEAEVERAAEAEELRQMSGEVMGEGRAALAQALRLLASGRYEEAEDAMHAALPRLHQLAALEPGVDGARALRDEAVAAVDEAQGFISTKRAIDDALEHSKTPGADILAYDALLEADLSVLQGASDAVRAKYRRELLRAEAAVDKRRRSIAKKVEKAKDAELRRAALAAVCGTRPDSSSLDFLVTAKLLLSQAAHDPDSIDVSSCSAPVMDDDLCWVSTCTVRGTNAFGVKVANRMRVISDRRGVVQVLR